jgi:hypothetical protein
MPNLHDIEVEPTIEIVDDMKKIHEPNFIRNMLLFAAMGSGANWVLPTVLFQEIPWFQDHMPEGLCISTYMNAANNFAVIVNITYLCINHFYRPIPHEIMLPFILSLSFFASIFVSFTYHIVINDVSVFIFIANFLAGTVGSLSSVIMNPFMTRFQNSYISAARAGGSSLILLCALVSIIQNPGGSTTFSPRIFILIFAVILIFPYFAYKTILNEKIGLKENYIEHEDSTSTNPLRDDSDCRGVELHGSESSKNIPDQESDQLINPNEACSPISFMQTEWFRKCVPHMLTVAWINFHTWGMLSAVTPFAMENAALDNKGSYYLAIAYQLAAASLVFGDLSTTLFKLNRALGLILFTSFAAVVYLAALDVRGFHTPSAAPCLVVIFSLGRFIEAHLVTCTYRAIATEFNVEHREMASRCVGFTEQICTTMGVVTSLVLVNELVSC